MLFYTYAYLREDGTPYYVGKGCNQRIHDWHGRITLPPKDRRVYLKQNLTEDEAYSHEVEMIAYYGRKDIGTGILRNCSNGGSGGDTGYLGSDEHRKLMRERKGDKNSFYGRKHTDESRKLMSDKLKGRTAHNKGKYKENASPHALYMREYRKRRVPVE